MNGAIRRDDFLVIGGGVVGLTVALELKRRHPRLGVAVLEKETVCGGHASGRNSGVLHAGFYYTADSLKARFSVDGNREMQEYCRERALPLNQCGKLVVARNESEWAGLDELLKRGRTNGVELKDITEDEAREIEPRVRTRGRAIFSPSTATVSPERVMRSLVSDARSSGVEVLTDTEYQGRNRDGSVETSWGRVEAGCVVNAAGLHADRIARDFGFSERHRILPFKGLYLRGSSQAPPLRTNVYPVPKLDRPFLGVHLTVTAHGLTKVGPTAVPALWRENYEGLYGFDVLEMLEILWREAGLFVTNRFGFRSLALEEMTKYRPGALVERASSLVQGLDPEHFHRAPAGIRAQLFDTREKRLEMDFRFEGDDRSFHVLNAVSPGFTCAFPFARHLADEIDMLIG